jgi:hypothetical protein
MKRTAGAFIILFLCLSLRTAPIFGVELSNVTITEDASLLSRFTRHTVTGIRTPLPQLPDVPGYKSAGFLAIGDIDEDGIKEIVCTSLMGQDLNLSTFDGAVAVFKAKGSNANVWSQNIINDTFAFPNDMLLRDMDDDGDTDIMVMDNYLGAWFTCGPAGIYYLENQGGDVTSPANWIKHTIFQGSVDMEACPCNPVGGGECTYGVETYHAADFYDIDGDGLEDFLTTKAHMWYWQWPVANEQYEWVEWFKKETDLETYPSGYSGPYEIGEGGGFFAFFFDVDKDGDPDVVAPQFLVQTRGTLIVKGYPDGSDIKGDTLAWFENPGQAAMLANPHLKWNRYTIENWYTSSNPIGKGFVVHFADIDNDSEGEILITNHNHQDYKPVNDPEDPNNHRIWPSGIYSFDVPGSPQVTANWNPITIDSGDPNLDPTDPVAVAADPFTVDRPGGPYSQGSPASVKAEDITGNSFPDMVLSGDGKGAVYYYESQGLTGTTLAFKRVALYKDPACMPGEVDADDLDGDGHKDIVTAIYDTSVNKDSSSGSIFIFSEDNCPTVSNPAQEDAGDGDGVGDACDNCSTLANPGQEDTYPPGGNSCGNACECEGNFDGNNRVDGTDAATFKVDFGRSTFSNPCNGSKPCNGDFTCNGNVDGSDAALFKVDFGRSAFNNPCPSCPTATWCSY